MRDFTIIDVIRRLGYQTDDTNDVSAGLQMAQWFYDRYGHEPPKRNGPKTKDPKGVHCFAHYSGSEQLKKAEEIVHAGNFEKDRQGQFDFGEAASKKVDRLRALKAFLRSIRYTDNESRAA